MQPLSLQFYRRSDVCLIARELLGKIIHTEIDGLITSGRIVETEAYSERERGCHAYQGRRTPRTEVFFEPGGVSYVYICYGIHRMFNIVTNEAEKADAVLIRAVEPLAGLEHMMARRGIAQHGKVLTGGPGRVAQALGIGMEHNGIPLDRPSLRVLDDGFAPQPDTIHSGPRIGMNFPGPDALLPWRYWIAGNRWLSR
ncbi:MAG: DNA-3-methyladenine glycosylase [Thiotrichaceae bacterium]